VGTQNDQVRSPLIRLINDCGPRIGDTNDTLRSQSCRPDSFGHLRCELLGLFGSFAIELIQRWRTGKPEVCGRKWKELHD
jgi:hypothetical protein